MKTSLFVRQLVALAIIAQTGSALAARPGANTSNTTSNSAQGVNQQADAATSAKVEQTMTLLRDKNLLKYMKGDLPTQLREILGSNDPKYVQLKKDIGQFVTKDNGDQDLNALQLAGLVLGKDIDPNFKAPETNPSQEDLAKQACAVSFRGLFEKMETWEVNGKDGKPNPTRANAVEFLTYAVENPSRGPVESILDAKKRLDERVRRTPGGDKFALNLKELNQFCP